MEGPSYFCVTDLECSSLHCEDNNLLKAELVAGGRMERKAERPRMPSIWQRTIPFLLSVFLYSFLFML